MSTAQDILTTAYGILRSDPTSTDIPGLREALMLKALDQANKEWLRAFRVGGEPPLFRKTEYIFDTIAFTTLSSDLSSGSTSASLTDSSNAESSGAIVIYDQNLPDIAEYTGNSSNTLTGLSGVQSNHDSGDQVAFLYELPSNFHSFRAEVDNYGGVTMNDNVPLVFTTSPPVGLEYSVYDNGTAKFLWLPLGISAKIRVVYNKKGTDIDDTGDSVDVPQEYEWFLVHRLIEHGRRSRGDNADQVLDAKSQGDDQLRQAMLDRNTGKLLKTRPISMNRNPLSVYRTNLREQ